MKLEPWELSDEQPWGEINYAALMEAFRRSEVTEAREARAARQVAFSEIFVGQFAEALLAWHDHAAAQLAQINESMRQMVEHMKRPRPAVPQPIRPPLPRRAQHLAPVPSLRVALAVNACHASPCFLPRPRMFHARRN